MKRRLREYLAAPRTRRVGLDAAALFFAVVAGVFAFSLAASGHIDIGPARLVVSVAPATSPRTVVQLPPFGSVEARTHRGPVRLDVRLQEIDVVGTTRLMHAGALSTATIDPETAADLPVRGVAVLAWRLLGGGLLAAALAGAVVALLLRRSSLVVTLAIAVAVIAPATAAGVAYATWDIAAFREPTLHGGLTYAPQLIDVFSTRVADITRLRQEASKVARDLASYYADQRSLVSGGSLPGTYRVLHVTDLHLDPVGASLARSIARSYDASLVIDTGDLPVLGVAVETNVFASLIDTSVPRIYIPGNHDSPASVAALRQLGVTVVTSGTIEFDGLRIFAVPDPISRGFGVEPDPGLVKAAATSAFAAFEASLISGDATPGIVAIHNPSMEDAFIGRVPLILSGHTHSARLYLEGGTVRLNSGTLGGMPYDPSTSGRRVLPYSASILYFTAAEPRRLIAVDRIDVYPTRSSSVSRDVIDETLLP